MKKVYIIYLHYESVVKMSEAAQIITVKFSKEKAINWVKRARFGKDWFGTAISVDEWTEKSSQQVYYRKNSNVSK